MEIGSSSKGRGDNDSSVFSRALLTCGDFRVGLAASGGRRVGLCVHAGVGRRRGRGSRQPVLAQVRRVGRAGRRR